MEWEPLVILQENDRPYPLLQSSYQHVEEGDLGPGVPCVLENQIPPFPTQTYFTGQGSM